MPSRISAGIIQMTSLMYCTCIALEMKRTTRSQTKLHSKYHESRMSYIQKAEHWKYTKHTTRIRVDEDLEHSLQSLALGFNSGLLDNSSWRNCVLSKRETDLSLSLSRYIRGGSNVPSYSYYPTPSPEQPLHPSAS